MATAAQAFVATLLDGTASPLVYTGVAVLAVVLLAVNWNLLTALSVWHLPGPFMLPIFGNALSLTSAPWLQFAAWHDVYGKIYRFGVFNLNFVAVCDPDAIKAILRTETGKFAKDQWTYDTFRPVLGRGLVTATGAKWRKHRNMLKPAFHFDSLRRLMPVFTQAAQRLCSRWAALPAGGNAVEMGLTFRTVTLEVISEVAVGLDAADASVLPVLFEAVLDELNQRVMQPWRAYLPLEAEHQRKLGELDALVLAIITKRRADRAGAAGDAAQAAVREGVVKASALGGDMLDLMLAYDEEHNGPGEKLTDTELADELKTMLLAGHETTSMMMLWSCYLLAKHPAALQRARAEIDAALGDYSACSRERRALLRRTPPRRPAADPEGDFGSYDAYKNLEFLEWVMFEAMRLYSPVPVMTREVLQDTKLCGAAVPKGSCVIMSCWALHRSKEVWGADADQFRPERFSKEGAKGRHPFAYMPFSIGERNCIGRNLALVEAKVVLGTVLQRWNLELTTAPSGKGADTSSGQVETDSYIIPVRPAGGLWMKVTPRK